MPQQRLATTETGEKTLMKHVGQLMCWKLSDFKRVTNPLFEIKERHFFDGMR